MGTNNNNAVRDAALWDSAPMQITMFGGFSIQAGDVFIKNSSSRSYQLWNLLEYLIAFRHKTISTSEMYDALWEEDEVDNPASALKNLIYRIRTVFADYDVPFSKSIVTYVGGTYQWNNAIPCEVDIEIFEQLYKKASNTAQPDYVRIENYKKAIELYRGDFLSSSNYKSWTVPVCSYYKSIYFKCVGEVLRLLSAQELYAEVELICQKALMIDQFEEVAHEYLIRAYSRLGQHAKAIAHYKHVSELFLNELGVHPSSSLRDLYRTIVKSAHSVEIDLGIITQDLREAEPPEGSFFCEYETFKSVYQVMARAAPRSDQSVYIVLYTIADVADEVPDTSQRKNAMQALFHSIQRNTRRCDVFSRFSATQYVLLLTTNSVENCNIALNRVGKAYTQYCKLPNIKFHTKIRLLE